MTRTGDTLRDGITSNDSQYAKARMVKAQINHFSLLYTFLQENYRIIHLGHNGKHKCNEYRFYNCIQYLRNTSLENGESITTGYKGGTVNGGERGTDRTPPNAFIINA